MTEPVLIAGAGPVGMTLALELARRDVESILLDRKPGLEREGSRAIVIARHTLETFARLGCAAPMLAKGVALRRMRTYFRDVELFAVDLPVPAEGDIPPFVNLQQTHTERHLLDRVAESGKIDVRWESEVSALEQDESGVTLMVGGPRGAARVRASYAVACDGAHSTMRKLLGVRFVGRSFADRFLIADIRADLPFPHERRLFYDPPFNPRRQVLIHPQPDREWRIDWQVPIDTDAEAERASGRLDRRIRAIVGDAPYELVWLTAYRFHERLAEHFRVGRVLLAGDAAHLFAPFGARGMNSGVEDARNLGWKLALVLAGHAPEALLVTYESERSAAARENLRVTSATMRFMAPPTALHRAVRDAVLRASLRSRRARRLVNSGKLAEPAVYGEERDGVVGRLAPLPAGSVDEMLGAGFAALLFCSDAEGERRFAEALASLQLPVSVGLMSVPRRREGDPPDGVVRLGGDVGGEARELAAACRVDGRDALFLVRPDGYLAAELPPDPRALGPALRSALYLE